jgi:hypothetical protein
LDETDAMVGRPVDPLAQGEGVTDAEVALAAGREGGDQDAGKTFVGRVHEADVGSTWDSVNAELRMERTGWDFSAPEADAVT